MREFHTLEAPERFWVCRLLASCQTAMGHVEGWWLLYVLIPWTGSDHWTSWSSTCNILILCNGILPSPPAALQKKTAHSEHHESIKTPNCLASGEDLLLPTRWGYHHKPLVSKAPSKDPGFVDHNRLLTRTPRERLMLKKGPWFWMKTPNCPPKSTRILWDKWGIPASPHHRKSPPSYIPAWPHSKLTRCRWANTPGIRHPPRGPGRWRYTLMVHLVQIVELQIHKL